MTLTRTDDSHLAEWWFTVDRTLLCVFLILVGSGIILSLAASPAIAVRKGLPAFYFAERQALFGSIGALLMLAVSLLRPRQVRRLSLLLLGLSLAGLVAVVVAGPEINGARRWARIAGFSLQPSEMMKPAFVVVSAWLLAGVRAHPGSRMLPGAIGLYAVTAALLLAEPDVGQALLTSLVWGALFFLSGQPMRRALAFAGFALAGAGIAAIAFEHARSRILRFLDPAAGDTFQVDRALQSFIEGGLLGRGPGEGSVKLVLPDAHTDFIFAVIGEELGAIACLGLIALYAFLLVRAAMRARGAQETGDRLAILGLALLIALQASINMGVNVGLLPAKGMTLPFISAGGSSTLAVCLAAGMLLALTRRRPDAAHVRMPQLGPTLRAVR